MIIDANATLTAVIVKPVDVEGAAIYAVELVLWIGIMWLGIVYNLREWIKGKGKAATTVNGQGDAGPETVADEVEMVTGDSPLARTSSSGSSSSSVFQTVGLRKQATNLFRRANRPKTYSAP